jgi:hypothetical protein
VPGPQLALRFAALTLFLVAVALGLWLLDVRPALVVVGMVIALGIAWAIEWLAWRASAEPLMRRPAPTEPPEEVAEPPREETPQVFVPSVGAGHALPADQTEPAAPTEREPGPPPAVDVPPVEERRAELRPVPPPPPAPEPGPAPETSLPPGVVEFPAQRGRRREWNLWELERLAREEVRRDPARRDEWAYLFLHLRRFASADGSLPGEFDPLVRESFGGLLEHSYNR